MQQRDLVQKSINKDKKFTIKDKVGTLFLRRTSAPDDVNGRLGSAGLVRDDARLFKTRFVSADASIGGQSQVPQLIDNGQIYFSALAVQSVKIKSSGYLKVEKGDLVRVYVCDTVTSGVFSHVVCGESCGRLIMNSLAVDAHTGNLYFEAIDLLVMHPTWLIALLESPDDDFPNRDRQLVMLLNARKLYSSALEGVLEIEFSQASGRDKNTALRHESPAVTLILSMLKQDEAITCFCQSWIHAIKSSIKKHSQNETISPHLVSLILKDCFDAIKHINIPSSLSVSLKAIKNVAEKYFSVSEQNSLMGSIVFLRLICPSLIAYNSAGKENLNFNKVAIIIAKALQLIANQVDPGCNDDLLYRSISTMRSYYPICEAFLSKMVEAESMHQACATPLVKEAALLYGLMLKKLGPVVGDDPLFLALKNRLGDVPVGAALEEGALPTIKMINQISDYIERSQIIYQRPSI